VLVHGSLAAVANGTINTLDARTDADVGFEARGLRLDRKNPWKQRRKISTPNLDAVRPPPPPPPPLVVAPPPPPVPQIPAAMAAKPAAAAPAPSPPAPPVGAPPPVPKPVMSGMPAPVISALPPMRPRAQTFPSIPATRYSTPSSIDTEEVDPEALAARLMQLSKDALIGGDANSLEKWSEGLMATGEKDNFAERMRAMARLSSGRVGDALRALGTARKNADATTPTKRCQAALALAVGFAFAGRTDEALLEGLDALARAREGKDDRAARACLAFLAKLYTSVGRTADATHLSVAASHLMSIPPSAR
jgi:hypothetical protein